MSHCLKQRAPLGPLNRGQETTFVGGGGVCHFVVGFETTCLWNLYAEGTSQLVYIINS